MGLVGNLTLFAAPFHSLAGDTWGDGAESTAVLLFTEGASLRARVGHFDLLTPNPLMKTLYASRPRQTTRDSTRSSAHFSRLRCNSAGLSLRSG